MSIATAKRRQPRLSRLRNIRGGRNIGNPYNNRPAAIRTLGGLAYNAVSQRGKDFLDEATAKSLLSMATRFLS